MKKAPPTKIKSSPEVLIDLRKVKFSPENPRPELKPEDKTYGDIKRSLEAFGDVQVIVWNKKTGNLIAGHQRARVMLDMGVHKAYAKVVNLTLEKERVLNVGLNKIGTGWDREKLSAVLLKIDAIEGDLEVSGFTEEERAMLDNVAADVRGAGGGGGGITAGLPHRCPNCEHVWKGDCEPDLNPKPQAAA